MKISLACGHRMATVTLMMLGTLNPKPPAAAISAGIKGSMGVLNPKPLNP